MRARLNGFRVSVMATELRRTSIARLSTDGDNKGARVVAVRYFLDRPGADLCGNQIYSALVTSTPSTRHLLDGVVMSVPHPVRSTEPARPRHRQEMT